MYNAESSGLSEEVSRRLEINGIEVEAHYSLECIRGALLPLLEKLTRLQKEKGRRLLVLVAAPPGAGKSTLCSFLELLSSEVPGLTKVQAVGMDGFHRRQEYLTTHTVVHNGQEIPMVKIKGAPITFDLEKLTEKVKELGEGGICGWPAYNRLLHNPVENALTVTEDIVLLEGNYLLLDEPGWRDLAGHADYTIFIRADEALLRERLRDRQEKSGKTKEEAAAFVEFSDLPNARLCLERSGKADITFVLDEKGFIADPDHDAGVKSTGMEPKKAPDGRKENG